jgi:hypothetical protein
MRMVNYACAGAVLCLHAFVFLSPRLAWGHGALAIGLPDSVADHGIAMGVSWNMPNVEAARKRALEECSGFQLAPVKTRALCKVVRTFSRQCVSFATDPKEGSPAWGWAVTKTLREAEMNALRSCKGTMMDFCIVTVAQCDTTP